MKFFKDRNEQQLRGGISMSKKGGFFLRCSNWWDSSSGSSPVISTESGKNLRNKLAKQADDLLDKASDYGDMAKDKSSLVEIAKDKAAKLGEQASGFTDSLTAKVR